MSSRTSYIIKDTANGAASLARLTRVARPTRQAARARGHDLGRGTSLSAVHTMHVTGSSKCKDCGTGACVSTGEHAVDARIVEALVSVRTGDNAVHARIVEALASVSTGEYAVNARIVEALASVSTGSDAVHARIVKATQNQS